MPEQRCLVIDGTKVFWKLYRKKQGSFDVLKLCIGAVRPEKEWASHHLPHNIVNACTTTAALAQAVRSVASEAMGVTTLPTKDMGCLHCKHDLQDTPLQKQQPPPQLAQLQALQPPQPSSQLSPQPSPAQPPITPPPMPQPPQPQLQQLQIAEQQRPQQPALPALPLSSPASTPTIATDIDDHVEFDELAALASSMPAPEPRGVGDDEVEVARVDASSWTADPSGSGARFREEWVEHRRPVVLSGCIGHWPALRRWSHAHLRAALGDKSVHVARTPDGLGDAVRSHMWHTCSHDWRLESVWW